MLDTLINYFLAGIIVFSVGMVYTRIKPCWEPRKFLGRYQKISITNVIVGVLKSGTVLLLEWCLVILMFILWPITVCYLVWSSYSDRS